MMSDDDDAGPCYGESLDADAGSDTYSAGAVAAVVILSMIISLVVGFVAGLCLSSRRQLRCLYSRVDNFWSGVATLSSKHQQVPAAQRSDHPRSRSSSKHAVQNTYDFGPGRHRTSLPSPGAGHYDAVPTAAPRRPPKDCNRQKCPASIVLEPKLNNLYVAGQISPAADVVDAPPQPPPRRHRPSTKR